MKLISEIKSKDGQLHFRRYLLLSLPWFDVCLHRIYLPDYDDHPHNHPWPFASLILWGGYVEQVGSDIRRRGMLSCKSMSTKKYHRVLHLLGSTSTWTLVFRGSRSNPDWGYLVKDQHVVHTDYRKLKNEGNLL